MKFFNRSARQHCFANAVLNPLASIDIDDAEATQLLARPAFRALFDKGELAIVPDGRPNPPPMSEGEMRLAMYGVARAQKGVQSTMIRSADHIANHLAGYERPRGPVED